MRLIIDNKFTILHKKIVNIIEHPGYGTLHYEILPLLNYDDQEVILTDSLNAIFFNHFDYYVIHTTGHMYYIVSNLEYLLKNNVNVSLFFHVAPNYYKLKKKKTFLNYIKKLQKKYNLKCFCPSLNVSNKYCEIGIMTVSVQVGIPRIDNRILAFNPNNSEYYNKIITTCTSSNSKYINIKGIDKFYKLMKKTNNLNNCMILGFDGSYKGILCKKFNNSDFLNILSHSSFFIQLSRTECYSVTQIQAKQLKIPLIVSDVDGNVDTVPNIYNRVDKFNKLVKEFDDKCDLAKTAIDYNYYSSLKKENIANFDKNLKRKVGI